LDGAWKRIVTLVQFSAQRDGSAKSGLLICCALLDAVHDVLVVFASEGPMIEEYLALGCEVTIVSHKNWLSDGQGLRILRNSLKERQVGAELALVLSSNQANIVYVSSAASEMQWIIGPDFLSIG
jgi:hypothetical protein